jgi:predicted lipoprotein with Yx(FWY)xxD motif
MTHTRHVGRCIAVGVGALVLWGGGSAMATTPPTEPPTDTAMETVDTSMGATSEPVTGAGPSACPPITDEAAADATATSAAATDTAAADMTATTEAADATAGEATAPTETAAAAMAGPFVQVAETDEYGPILVDSGCRALYAFTQDVDGEPTCVDDCAVNWPPLTTTDEAVPPLADELDPSLFSIVQHPDGPQLKVGDWPLYHFAGDAAPGDLNGQGVGGVWWLVAPDGTLYEEAVEGTAPTDTGAAEATAPAATMPTDMAPVTTAG